MTRRHANRSARPQSAPSPAAAAARAAPGPDPEGLLFALLQALVAVLLAARMLAPPEAAVEGNTLWLVELWFVAGLVWAWDAWRRDDGRLRLDLCDLAVWLVVAGHVTAALWTFRIGGDRRAALNLMWEWVALGASFSLLRQVLRRIADGRRLLLATLCLAAGLAGLGIWQHYVGLPESRREYEALMTELAAVRRAAPDIDAAEALARRQRAQELEQRLIAMRVPGDPQGRRVFEDRLRSTEPFGLFALANTFAAILLAWLMVALALGVRRWTHSGAEPRRAGTPAMAFGSIVVVLLGYCLVLTKSRTAWVGLGSAVLVWLLWERRARRKTSAGSGPPPVGASDDAGSPHRRRIGRTAIGVAGLLIAAMVFVAVLSGGLDQQVLSEAPKSFRYRLQYWVGAAGVVRDHPLLGVGPGNFRQHYLRHKLPASSEEIAEPHNLILDLWANGGLLAVGGALLLIVAGGRGLARRAVLDAAEERGAAAPLVDGTRAWLNHPLVWGTGGAGLVMLAWTAILGAPLDERLIGLFGGWLVLIALGRAVSPQRAARLPIAGIGAACAGVLVHLLGSGGIEMPAVPQMLLVLLAVATSAEAATWSPRWRNTPLLRIGAMVAAAVLCAVCWMTATAPVFQREALLGQGDAYRSGDSASGLRPNPRRAAQLYAQAAESDPLSAEPLVRLADLAISRMILTNGSDEADFEHAVQYTRLAIAADPHSAALHRLLAQVYLTHFRQRQEPRSAELAAAAMGQALARYPASAQLQAEAALAFEATGDLDSARRHADRALETDKINRREGHLDKYLPEVLRMEVQRLARLE